ncbi:putative RNA-directed DNA polymerase from transposon BS [Exaiptasia diaphana]|nr:putative RNA-directed DNA polymerase from transposon BS [Exaiptasia diaphana]
MAQGFKLAKGVFGYALKTECLFMPCQPGFLCLPDYVRDKYTCKTRKEMRESPIRAAERYGSYLCLQPKSGDCNPIENQTTWTHGLVWKLADKSCSAEYMKFLFDADGIIYHKCSGKIVCPHENRDYPNSQRLVLIDKCSDDIAKHKRRTAASILDEFHTKQRERINTDDEKLEDIRLLRSDLKAMETSTDNYYPLVDTDVEKQVQYLPPTVQFLLKEMFSGAKTSLKVAAIGQALIQSTRPRSILAPLQIGLAIQLHHRLASRFLIDTLHNLGFCSSYQEVLLYKQNAAVEQGTSIPEYNEQFVQYVTDNVDHNLHTLDVHNTFHGMGIIAAVTPGTEIMSRIPRKKVCKQDITSADRGPNSYIRRPLEDLIAIQRSNSTTKLGRLYASHSEGSPQGQVIGLIVVIVQARDKARVEEDEETQQRKDDSTNVHAFNEGEESVQEPDLDVNNLMSQRDELFKELIGQKKTAEEVAASDVLNKILFCIEIIEYIYIVVTFSYSLIIHEACSQSLIHGFRTGMSCETQLVLTCHDWANILNQQGQIDALLLDFSKAFDKVSHTKLLHKLGQYGVNGKTQKWISGFLHNRTQFVAINGTHSSTTPVTSGVPQGSVLGPTLFLLYINDIVDVPKSELRLFADDTVLYRAIKSQHDHQILQEDLHNLTKWASDWQMDFNVSKCHLLRVTNKRKPHESTYSANTEALAKVSQCDYLGIRCSETLRWGAHCSKVAAKANKTLGLIRRTLKSCSREVKERAYMMLVRPTLEYASSSWNPHTDTDVNRLEQVQKNAARFVCNNYKLTTSTSGLVSSLGWDTLEHRRLFNQSVLFYKFHNGLINCKLPDSLMRSCPQRSTRRHCLTYQQQQSTVLAHSYSFFPRTVRVWNLLPSEVVTSTTLNSFKQSALPAIRSLKVPSHLRRL